MKTKSKLIHSTITATAIFFGLAIASVAPLRADNLIVDGTTISVPGGSYGTVVVKNFGDLIITGIFLAERVTVVTQGTLTVVSNTICRSVSVDGTMNIWGQLSCSNLAVLSGTTTVLGVSNRATSVSINGELVALGDWYFDNLTVASNGVLKVYTINSSIPGSGTIALRGNIMHIASGGLLNAYACGSDPRGQGHDWYRNSDGGGHGGMGGRGYWDSSCCGNEGQAFGAAHTYESFMGGAGGLLGGGGVLIEAEDSFVLDGTINADGQSSTINSSGGGAGGGVLVRSPSVTLSGKIYARGGGGGEYSGGGGGGRAKICYGNSTLPDISGAIDVSGGAAGGYRNTQPGQPGTIYQDYIPELSELQPPDGSVVTNGSILFRFRINDLSYLFDGHTDSNAALIELSQDGFRTVAITFNQNTDIAGWDKLVYYSGDVAQYMPQAAIPPGAYEWRAAVRDGTLYSRYTTPRALLIETNPPPALLTVGMLLTPTVVIHSDVGTTVRIEYRETLAPADVWSMLATIWVNSNPELYYDLSGVGKPSRFYRLVTIP